MKIAIDVDGCLIDKKDTPNYDLIQLLDLFVRTCNDDIELYVWSGSGLDYAKRWVEKLGLDVYEPKVIQKGSIRPDIVFDDEDVGLGKINIKVF